MKERIEKVSRRKEPRHGTCYMYGTYGCRCAACKNEHNKRTHERKKTLIGRTPPHHGTSYIYIAYKCRCDTCKSAYNAIASRAHYSWRNQFKREWDAVIGAKVVHTRNRNTIAYVVSVTNNVCTLSKKLNGSHTWPKFMLLGAPPRELKITPRVEVIVPAYGQRQRVKRPHSRKKSIEHASRDDASDS